MNELEPPLPAVAALVLVELTERALAHGLPAALSWATRQLATIDGIERVDAEVDGNGNRVVGALGPAGAAVVPALDAALSSAQRAVAAQASEAARIDALQELARVDELTGALNRRAFLARLDDELARAQRAATPITLVLYDLDAFKAINDRHGHPTGDAALRAFAERLEANLRGSDSVGRIGGDEFALILIGADEEDEDRILARLATSLETAVPGCTEVQASFGTARFPTDGSDREALIAAADRRLYDHKRRPQA